MKRLTPIAAYRLARRFVRDLEPSPSGEAPYRLAAELAEMAGNSVQSHAVLVLAVLSEKLRHGQRLLAVDPGRLIVQASGEVLDRFFHSDLGLEELRHDA